MANAHMRKCTGCVTTLGRSWPAITRNVRGKSQASPENTSAVLNLDCAKKDDVKKF